MNSEKKLAVLLKERQLKISVAESCTGGLIASRITNIPGSSDYFELGVITYSNSAKIALLQVSAVTIERYGAVSRYTASEMALGVKRLAKADISLAVTGIAGPSGGSKKKPVGLVYIAVSLHDKTICKRFNFSGTRINIKNQTAQAGLNMAYEILSKSGKTRRKISTSCCF